MQSQYKDYAVSWTI